MMIAHLKPALVMLLFFTVLTGIVYPLLVTFSGQLLFSQQANGSLLGQADKPIGSVLIGQPFTRPEYFWGRPSATAPGPYNAAASSGSNQGPSNPALLAVVSERINLLHAADPHNNAAIPVDLVTASASGLDPHISPAAAAYQSTRVAKARQQPIEKIRALVSSHTESRQWGMFGEPRVNVLQLNLALDSLH